MSAYLIVDADDLLKYTLRAGIDLQELAVALRGNAALVAGLYDLSMLRAIAVADWEAGRGNWHVDPQTIFRNAGYEIQTVTNRADLVTRLVERCFVSDPRPVDELILATTVPDLLPLIEKLNISPTARIRVWGVEDGAVSVDSAVNIFYQPLESLPGIQTKNVWVYIDFENVAISLNEHGYVVNLDHLIERFQSQAQAHGRLVKMSAYAPWGQRGALPPLVDSSGREVAEDAPSRLMMANIDPVFNLPGKNSADMRMARDVLTDAGHPEAGDVIILASSDRDFNDVINPLLQRNKTVVVWGVRGSTGRLLQMHPSLHLEFIGDFTDLTKHKEWKADEPRDENESFVPSQWSSVIIQCSRMMEADPSRQVTAPDLIKQLLDIGDVISDDRGHDLVSQAITHGILRGSSDSDAIELNQQDPTVEKTLLIVDRMVRRVANTLQSRSWEYVNYGFLLKGLAMERDLDRPGMNSSDQWRSHWIDCLVREGVLQRDLVPHRHNPEDLVPVIRVPAAPKRQEARPPQTPAPPQDSAPAWLGTPPHKLYESDPAVARMVSRIVVSVEQFTSFRNFAWCPLGSLHRRLREFDSGATFQYAVEYLLTNELAAVNEYPNPRSEFNTKGIELDAEKPFVAVLLAERDEFVRVLLELYNENTPIEAAPLKERLDDSWDVDLWLSIMKTENVLNALPGRAAQFSLFRTHHTVKQVAQDEAGDTEKREA